MRTYVCTLYCWLHIDHIICAWGINVSLPLVPLCESFTRDQIRVACPNVYLGKSVLAMTCTDSNRKVLCMNINIEPKSMVICVYGI